MLFDTLALIGSDCYEAHGRGSRALRIVHPAVRQEVDALDGDPNSAVGAVEPHRVLRVRCRIFVLQVLARLSRREQRRQLEIVPQRRRVISLTSPDVPDDVRLSDRFTLGDRSALLERARDLSEACRLVDDERDHLGRFQGDKQREPHEANAKARQRSNCDEPPGVARQLQPPIDVALPAGAIVVVRILHQCALGRRVRFFRHGSAFAL
jgi:hypothetical protein